VLLPSGANIPVILLGNKEDLLESSEAAISDEEIDHIVQQHQFMAFYKCSAMTGSNVKEACGVLVDKIAENQVNQASATAQPNNSASDSSSSTASSNASATSPIKLASQTSPASSSSGGCCS